MNKILLGVEVQGQSKEKVLENVTRALKKREFTHVVSLNPEVLVEASHNPAFKTTLNQAQIKLIDGVGVLIACRILGIAVNGRFSGVDLMDKMVRRASGLRLKVALIGGKGDLAERLADRYSQAQTEAIFLGMEGFKNAKNPEKDEENRIKSKITDLRPHLVFVSFGSPVQELWIDSHRDLFKNCVVVGVGGAFSMLAGDVSRAPRFMRSLGLEWLFRLWVEPWRWKRQLSLIRFAVLVARQRVWNRE